MKVQTIAVLVTLAVCLCGCNLLANDCSFTAPREASVDAKGAAVIRIVAGAGFLRVDGRAGLDEVRVSGTACSSLGGLLEKIELTARREGEDVLIETHFPDGMGQMKLDLEIELPDGVALDVEDSSGSLEIRNVASVELKDGSGKIVIEGLSGDLRLHDSSGGIDVTGIEGDVWVRDSSGGIDIQKVKGSVIVDLDSSGGIDVSDVEGNVLVRQDSSGGISVRHVKGDFTVENDSTGGIHHSDVGGQVKVPKG